LQVASAEQHSKMLARFLPTVACSCCPCMERRVHRGKETSKKYSIRP
jgi:hypothetical protein